MKSSMLPPVRVRVPEALRNAAESVLAEGETLSGFIEQSETPEHLDAAQNVIDDIKPVCDGNLSQSPFSYRKAGASSLRREPIIPSGGTGCVAQHGIEPATSRVVVLAARHQREEDCL